MQCISQILLKYPRQGEQDTNKKCRGLVSSWRHLYSSRYDFFYGYEKLLFYTFKYIFFSFDGKAEIQCYIIPKKSLYTLKMLG